MIQFVPPDEPIPMGTWRVGFFALPASVAQGRDEAWIIDYIIQRVGRGGVAVAEDSLTYLDKMSVEVAPGVPGVVWGALMESREGGLTPRQLMQRAGIGVLVSDAAVGTITEHYLDSFVGRLWSDVSTPRPVLWSSPDSMLRANTWYATFAIWEEVAPSVQQLEGMLEQVGMDVWSGDDLVKGYMLKGHPGYYFLLHTGDQARRVKDIQRDIGAFGLVVNVAAGYESDLMTMGNELRDLGQDAVSTLHNFHTVLAETPLAITDALATLLTGVKYLLYAAIPVAVAYGGWRGYHWWKKERASVRAGRGGSERRLFKRRRA
jgi:hypothetical protein